MVRKNNDIELIAYCSLYCGDFHGYSGKIPDLARDLRKELRGIHYDKLPILFLIFCLIRILKL